MKKKEREREIFFFIYFYLEIIFSIYLASQKSIKNMTNQHDKINFNFRDNRVSVIGSGILNFGDERALCRRARHLSNLGDPFGDRDLLKRRL